MMSTSVSLCTVAPFLVKIDIVPLLEVLPMLINDEGKSWNVSACFGLADRSLNGSCVTNFAWLTPPLATPCRKPLGIVPYVRTLVQYIRIFGAPD